MKVLRVDTGKPDILLLAQAGEIVKKGGLVAFPTETVYGIAASIKSDSAIDWLYGLKKRPREKPFAYQFSSLDDFFSFSGKGVSRFVRDFFLSFLPGPVTVVYFDTVLEQKIGVRIPDHTVTQAFLSHCGGPVFAPSANPSGLPSPADPEKVIEYFENTRLDALIDAGPCRLKQDSTVVEISEPGYSILRHGALGEDKIAEYFQSLR